jgi:hypothetical protein
MIAGASNAAAGSAAAGAGPGMSTSEFAVEDADYLYQSAAGDFLHDFDEAGRSDVTLNILNKVPIEYSKTPSKNYKLLNDIINNAKNAAGNQAKPTPAQAYWVFRNDFNLTVPASSQSPPDAKSEEKILVLAGVEYNGLLSNLSREKANSSVITELGENELGFTNKRTYNARALPTKVEGERKNLVDVFAGLTNGQRSFVLMWDAGAISITTLAEDREDGPYHFFFIRNKENLSDPAGKISADSMRSSKNVRVYFLEDQPGHVSQYPVYAGGGTTNENLYSNFTLTTQLNPEKRDAVSGTILVKAGDSSVNMVVQDIGVQSEVSETVTKAIHMKLNGEPPEQYMPYFFLKRAGDWCQALSLLDRDRKYIVKHAPGYSEPDGWVIKQDSSISVGELESKGALVAMITLDRIMLAYLLAAGIHVFYTNVRAGSTWMIYFQNTMSGKTDDAGTLFTESEQMPAFAEVIITTYNNIVKDITTTTPPEVASAEYIAKLRKKCLLLKSIPPPDSVKSTLEIINTVKTQDPTPPVVATLRNAIAKLKTAHANLPLDVPPSSVKDQKLEEEITTLFEKIVKGVAISRNDAGFAAFYSFVDDIRSVQRTANLAIPSIVFSPGAPFPSTRSSSAAVNPGQLLQQRWNTLGQTGGKRMKGGNRGLTFDDCYSVYAYHDDDPETSAVAALLDLNMGVVTASIGSSVVLPNGFVATVVDDILIDPDTEGVLNYQNYEGEEEDVVRALPDYIELRQGILRYDKIRAELQKLKSSNALDSATKRKVYEIEIEITRNQETVSSEDDLDVWLIKYVNYPPLDIEDPESGANAAMLTRIAQREEELYNACNSDIAEYYKTTPINLGHEEGLEALFDATEIGEMSLILDSFQTDPNVVSELQGPSTAAAPAAAGNAGWNGGLRKRRSLYSNAGQTPLVNVDGTSDDAGLRERVGPSITRRVRKSTRSTRRRR